MNAARTAHLTATETTLEQQYETEARALSPLKSNDLNATKVLYVRSDRRWSLVEETHPFSHSRLTISSAQLMHLNVDVGPMPPAVASEKVPLPAGIGSAVAELAPPAVRLWALTSASPSASSFLNAMGG